MDLTELRQTLATYPLDGWWDRTTQIIDDCFAQGMGTDNFSWDNDRHAKHDAIVQEFLDKAAEMKIPRQRVAMISGGFAGSGKTHVIFHRGWNRQYVTTDPDVVKSAMIRYDLIPEVKTLTPLEASVLAHVESTQIAKKLFFAAAKMDYNVLWDFTMSNAESIQLRLEILKRMKFSCHSFFVSCSPEVAKARVIERHRRGIIRFLSGDGLGGRYVPLHRIDFEAPKKVFEMTKKLFVSFEEIDNRENDFE